jgi:hypothetical protein
MQTVARYAHLDNTIEGIALRDSTGRVSFQTRSTGLWTTLTNADAGRLTLLGHCALADAQWRTDLSRGDLARLATSRQNMEVGR